MTQQISADDEDETLSRPSNAPTEWPTGQQRCTGRRTTQSRQRPVWLFQSFVGMALLRSARLIATAAAFEFAHRAYLANDERPGKLERLVCLLFSLSLAVWLASPIHSADSLAGNDNYCRHTPESGNSVCGPIIIIVA